MAADLLAPANMKFTFLKHLNCVKLITAIKWNKTANKSFHQEKKMVWGIFLHKDIEIFHSIQR